MGINQIFKFKIMKTFIRYAQGAKKNYCGPERRVMIASLLCRKAKIK